MPLKPKAFKLERASAILIGYLHIAVFRQAGCLRWPHVPIEYSSTNKFSRILASIHPSVIAGYVALRSIPYILSVWLVSFFGRLPTRCCLIFLVPAQLGEPFSALPYWEFSGGFVAEQFSVVVPVTFQT
uniref:Uncharacterized protein LOC104222886 n=1 Tax=Nicotiana sylvestris TaxID=4096 RepID=A0A1U7WE59_NICSY|nr:PREDICTED: uncharacterized protein LOC104222886 [Nicotiana sylvestris]